MMIFFRSTQNQKEMTLFNFRVVLCRIRLFPTLISKIKWMWSGLPLKLLQRTSVMVFTTFVNTFFGFLTLLFFVIIIGTSWFSSPRDKLNLCSLLLLLIGVDIVSRFLTFSFWIYFKMRRQIRIWIKRKYYA